MTTRRSKRQINPAKENKIHPSLTSYAKVNSRYIKILKNSNNIGASHVKSVVGESFLIKIGNLEAIKDIDTYLTK